MVAWTQSLRGLDVILARAFRVDGSERIPEFRVSEMYGARLPSVAVVRISPDYAYELEDPPP